MVIPEVVIIAVYLGLILLLAFPRSAKKHPGEELEDAIAKYLTNLEKDSKGN